ncbi:hypothetical protein BH24ACI5_BH24ACI5_03140 [soil metagenome]
MPAYNVGPYLRAAAESVIAQTYPAVELLIVDDGSTDGTHAVASELQQRWPDRVRLFHHENKGLSEARNTGLAAATGEYLALLDSDDLWEPDFLTSQMALLESRPEIDIVTGNARFLGGPRDGQPVTPLTDPRPEPSLHTILTDEEAVFIMSVFRRRVMESIGGFSPTLKTNEDFDFWLRAAHAGFRFARNSTPLGWYRVRPDSLSANEVRMLRGAVRVLRAFEPRLPPASPAADALRSQLHRFQARLPVAAARRGAREAVPLSHAEFFKALPGLGGIRRAAAAVLARYAPLAFRGLHAVWGKTPYSLAQPTALVTPRAADAGSADRAGKAYWENVWTHLSFPAEIDPRDPNIWAHRDQQFHRFFCDQLAGAGERLSLLELGCARSAWLPYFAREFGCRVAGLDYSELGARQSAERLAESRIAADIRCADLFDPPADWVGHFDVVVWFGVAEHFEDTAAAIRAAAAYVKPGGLLVTEVPNMVGLNGWLQRLINRPIYDIHVPLDLKDLVAHHRTAGLDVVDARYLLFTDFDVLNLENLPRGLARGIKDRLLYALRLLTGCLWWLDRRIGPLRPGRVTGGFVVAAARRPADAAAFVPVNFKRSSANPAPLALSARIGS